MMECVSKFNMRSVVLILYLSVSWSMVRASSCVLGGFDSQVEEVLREVQMPSSRLADMRRVLVDVQRVLQDVWPGCTIEEFGATTTGLALNGSDVDLFVFIPHRTKLDADDATLISQVHSQLEQHTDLFKNIRMKPNVDVPVLSFEHVPADISVDLTVTSPLIVRAAVLLGSILKLHARILNMANIVKYWSNVHLISGNEYALPSYAINLLVIFYLQQRNILPSIASLQENIPPIVVGHWNTAFTLPEKVTINESFYELLGGFFKYYSNFNFDNVISPHCACVLKREQIEDLQDLPKELSSYEDNLKSGYASPFVFGPVNIQDLLGLDINQGRPWNNRSMLDNLMSHSKYAAEVYDTVSRDKFLSTILKSDKKEERDYLDTFWSRQEEKLDGC